MHNVSGYLRRPFGSQQSIERMLADAKRDLADIEFDTVVGTGLSGTLVAPLIAREMDKNFAIVRKEVESSHGLYSVEGSLGERWILADDQIDTGATLERVQRDIGRECADFNHETEFVGAWLYACDEGFRSPEEIKSIINW